MLAVISNQHLTKNNIRRKAGKCKTAHSSPPDYETRNIVSTSGGVSCAENDEELCHATGYTVFDGTDWWDEFVDSNGDLQYGR